MYRIRCGLLVVVMLFSSLSRGQDASLHLMPLPRSIQVGQRSLNIATHFHAGFIGPHDARLDAALDRFLARLDHQCGNILRMQYTQTNPSVLVLQVAGPGETVQSVSEDESYRLKVDTTQAALTAATDVGAMHGLETLLQLAQSGSEGCSLPAVVIDDAPRFPWRGLELDVARHFEPVSVIKRTLDGMAVAKLNVFHWHLSDDQGFRAESRKLPRLTDIGSGGQFYTQDQMREVVAYARERGIRVMPEFDVPGHSTSWVASYPELGDGRKIDRPRLAYHDPQAELDPTNEKLYEFLDTFIGEMADIFPDAYFHIGGDETGGKGWLANPRIKLFMQQQGFKTTSELQAYFNRRLYPIVTKHNKKVVGWDEIYNSSLPKDIMIHRRFGAKAPTATAAAQGYASIVSQGYYLDHDNTAEQMFLPDPIPAETALSGEQQKLVLGGEACMWGEVINEKTIDSRIWPRALAVAERLWSPQSDRDVADMYRRLRFASRELEDVGLTHISGPEALRRSLVNPEDPTPFNVLASVVEPINFIDRIHAQNPDTYTAFNRFVDAVAPDPKERQEIASEVDSLADEKRGTAEIALRRRFEAWQRASPILVAWAHRDARLLDMEDRARQLGALAQMGLDSLAYLDANAPGGSEWFDHQMAIISDAQKPSAMVRFVFLPSLQKLVEAAAQQDRSADK